MFVQLRDYHVIANDWICLNDSLIWLLKFLNDIGREVLGFSVNKLSVEFLNFVKVFWFSFFVGGRGCKEKLDGVVVYSAL